MVEWFGGTEDQVVVNFGYASGSLWLHEICRPQEFQDTSRIQVGPYMVGEQVVSLRTILHWRHPLQKGQEGFVECRGATDADVVVNFGHVCGQLKLHQICRPEHLEETVELLVGPYRVGDRVRSLRSFPFWRPQPLLVGDEGLVECYGATEADVIVNFGHVTGQLRFNEILGPEHVGGTSWMQRVPDRASYGAFSSTRGSWRIRLAQVAANALPTKCVERDSEEPCAICQQSLLEGEEERWLPCFHRFHADCIDRWLQVRATCPLDNMELGEMLLLQHEIEDKVE